MWPDLLSISRIFYFYYNSADDLVVISQAVPEQFQNTGIKPTMWKIAQLCAGNKKVKCNLSNYHQIISKVIGAEVNYAIKCYLFTNNLYGFRLGHSVPHFHHSLSTHKD